MNNENKDATEAAVIEATKEAYNAFQDWGKSGFPTPLPESLLSGYTEKYLATLAVGARWHIGVRLQGDIEITEIKALTVGENSAVVQVTANDDNVTFTVDGQPRDKLKNDTRTSKVELVYDKTWKIDDSTEMDNPASLGT